MSALALRAVTSLPPTATSSATSAWGSTAASAEIGLGVVQRMARARASPVQELHRDRRKER